MGWSKIVVSVCRGGRLCPPQRIQRPPFRADRVVGPYTPAVDRIFVGGDAHIAPHVKTQIIVHGGAHWPRPTGPCCILAGDGVPDAPPDDDVKACHSEPVLTLAWESNT